MKKIALLCATTAFVLPGMAMAQSTGTITTEEDNTVVVTGNRTRDVNGITVPDTAKAQGVLGQELIQTQAPGQSILQTVNLVPGVNFTNSDPYGSAGGNLRIRGFDGNRVSLTFDGIPLNDSGNYAIFSNQQLDPELIEQVNVNLGQTDVDSPTASAAGGTVNYRTILPSRELFFRVNGSVGDFGYRRGHIQLHSGEWWENGPRAFVSYSNARNDLFRGPGEIYKQQWNARIYYALGTNGDFISVAGHYNRNRNNFYRNPAFNDLRTTVLPDRTGILGVPGGVPGSTIVPPADPNNPSLIGSDYTDAQWDSIFDFNNFETCTRASEPGGAGAQNDNGGRLPTGSTAAANTSTGGANNILNTSSCSNFAGVRINPSNTGNIRINGRFTLADNLLLTVDPSFQYVLANGGGSTAIAENNVRVRGGTPASPGVDYNGDGDFLDTIRFYTPNNTNTHRLGLTASLIWDFAQNQRLRVAYTFDRAKHRQTGEWGYLDANGNPESPFSGRNATPVLDATGFQFQQRDRESIAMLNQVAGQYIGRFFDERLRLEVGLRMPFFKRELDQRCLTEARGSGFAYCTSETAPPLLIIAPDAVVPAVGPTPYYAPFQTTYKFDAILPNVGIVYNFGGGFSAFGSYAMGFSAPRTDNLYRAPRVDNLDPEKTDAFDLGIRYSRSTVQAQATAWMINYSNRIVTSFNPDLGISLDRNVGKVDSWGVDASVAWQIIPEFSIYALGSYINAELQDNVNVSAAAGVDCGQSTTTIPVGCAPTAGKMVPETPEWTFGGRAQANLGPMTIGAQFKWVDSRFATDVNDIVVDDYTVWDVDVRFDLGSIGLPESYVQFNATNLFNERYFGNISTQLNAAGNPNFSTGSPQTFMITLNLAWRAGR
ncbi:MAG TPA: TonB-dependent receptor [Allosphingosinicella sp.]|nr:TonB-dependent receptor [Allosphingosinicella sp.]